MSHSVTYICTHQLLTNPGTQQSGFLLARPWVEVVVDYLGTHQTRVWCLVDSGADDTVLDLGTAARLSVDLSRLQPRMLGGIGGPGAPFRVCTSLSLSFAGTTVAAETLFGPTPIPLLGRSAMFNSNGGIEIGLDETLWHHT